MAGVLSDAYGEPFFAKEAGAFARHGFDIDVSAMNNAGGTIAAMSGGSLEMGLGDLFVRSCNAPGRSHRAARSKRSLCRKLSHRRIWRPRSTLRFAHLTISPARPWRSLRCVLVRSLRCGHGFWFSQNNVDPGQVKFIELTQPAMVPAMERGTIDAGIMAEPFITLFKSRIRDVGHPYDVIGKESPFSVW